MIRLVLPVALFTALSVCAQQLTVPGLSLDIPAAPLCENHPYEQSNCVRVLACIGSDGLYFDGQARGWDQGTVTGHTSTGTACAGHWQSDGFMGSGTSQMKCADESTVNVLYYTQDNETGTVTGRGMDSYARSIIVWTGENVLDYLTPEGSPGALLPCGPTSIPIS
jgi:hypothetical protein